jgi:glycosyltransferase involved in cell wall biosynthesis
MTSPEQNPLVSVICICHNQADYVVEALASVEAQTYDSVELIVVDDASEDNSAEIIENYIEASEFPIRFVRHSLNQGHCRVFNLALKEAGGTFIIDLAADDVLMNDRVSVGIDCFSNQIDRDFGVHFSDAELINESSGHLGYHYTQDYFPNDKVPQGQIFQWLLRRYFINPPTMMYKRTVLDRIGGYDESLNYEDFDFWVRSSRYFNYCYTPEVLAKKRLHSKSKSAGQYSFRSKMLASTLQVCYKALDLCQNVDDLQALKERVNYEQRQALASLNMNTFFRYISLRRQINKQLSDG